jgi:hypothetical protein
LKTWKKSSSAGGETRIWSRSPRWNADPEVMRYFVESGLFPKRYLSSDNVKDGFFNPLYKLVSENNAVK